MAKEDEVFGRVEYEGGLWTHMPSPNTQSPMVIISALAEGPSAGQRAFYLQLQSRMNTLCEDARLFLSTEGVCDFNPSGLSLYSVEIPEDDVLASDSFVLELTDGDANMVYGVSFEHGKPKRTYTDD